MNFDIEQSPPSSEMMANEYAVLRAEHKQIKRRDTIISFVLIIAVSLILSVLVYLYTEDIRYTMITGTVIPLVGSVLALMGVVVNAGFRSAAHRIITLEHEISSLEGISSENDSDVARLAEKYEKVREYIDSVRAQSRSLVNGELAIFWAWDTSTVAEAARGKDYIEQAKHMVDIKEADEPQFDI